jgi:NADH-quinone oxidoreductase subunit F
VVMNSSTCMVKIARFFMKLPRTSPAASAFPAGSGTSRSRILDEHTSRAGARRDPGPPEELLRKRRRFLACGLGKVGAFARTFTLRQFRAEYEAHVIRKVCPTASARPWSDLDRSGGCKGCTVCAKEMPGSGPSPARRGRPTKSTSTSA